MNQDVLLIIGGVVLILFMGLFWAWQSVRQSRKRLKFLEDELIKSLQRRRHVIPYLIESFRMSEQAAHHKTTEVIDSIIEFRAAVRPLKSFPSIWEAEHKLETALAHFLNKVDEDKALQKDIGWLEARTDIKQINQFVKSHEKEHTLLQEKLNSRLNRFPFRLFK